jgi:tetratricopeptide (TPR) repeat protein
MKAWLESDAPKLSREFETAISSFQQFLDAQSKLVHWAEYGIACLYATSAANQVTRKLPASERYERAVRHFEKFLQNLDGLDAQDQGETIKLARTVLDIDPNGKRELAGPVECPAIKEAWVGIGRDWERDVLSKLSMESKPRAASL